MIAILEMVVLLGALLLLSAACSAEKVFYVSPVGKDSWTGSSPTPTGTDGPLATLDGARRAARNTDRSQPVRVIVADGHYLMRSTLVFEPEDSGTAQAPITYEAAKGARPMFSAGRQIKGFKQRSDGLWEVQIPDVAEGRWYFEQLWVNGRRAVRARTPNTGYLYATELTKSATYKHGTGEELFKRAFIAAPDDFKLLADLTETQLKDVQVTIYFSWETAKMRVSELDSSNNIVYLVSEARWPFSSGTAGSPRYHLENFAQALDSPGEWFLSREGTLLYSPLEGEDPETATVYAPVAEDFMLFAGDADSGKAVRHIQFKGLQFSHSQYLLPAEGHRIGQAEVDIGAAITLFNAHDVHFTDCTVNHIGTYAFWFRKGSRGCSVNRCLLEDMGAGGVKIGEFAYSPDDAPLVKNISVDNCIIRGGGKIHHGAIGVIIGHSPDNKVTHNDISDLHYSCISVGWSWGYKESNAINNTIEFNHLHHIGYGVLSDMGGVYTLGVSPGTSVSGNVVHDVTAHQYGGWGLYNDEGSTGIVLKNNLIYRCNTGGYHQHYGKENHFTNNIIAYCGEEQIIRSREEEHLSFTIDHNIVLFDALPLGGTWKNGNFALNNNLYFQEGGSKFAFAGQTFEKWQESGQDTNSIIADPLFVNPAKDNFKLRPNSPALGIGFVPFDYSKAGVYGDKAWRELAKAYEYPDTSGFKVIIAPEAVSNNFESTPVGAFPQNFGNVSLEGLGDSIEVTDETAASGKHSLKFIDKSGLSAEHNPHLLIPVYYYKAGVAECSFDVRVEKNSKFWHEWRDWRTAPYTVGPRLHIENEKLYVNQEPLMDIPLGVWTHIGITCRTGTGSTGTWTLEVTVSGERKRIFKDLKIGTDSLNGINSLLFVANANENTVFYIDNVEFK